MNPARRVPAGTSSFRDSLSDRARRAALVLAVSIVASVCGGAADAATTYVSAQQRSDKGNWLSFQSVSLDFNSQPVSQTVGAGYTVIDGLQSGSRDRFELTGGVFVDYLGRTFYAGIRPVSGIQLLNVEIASLNAWQTALDPDGTLDVELGTVFGEVRDAGGAPIAGAVVTITPDGGDVFYFDEAGEPSLTLTQTSSSGRYVILDVPPGNVAVNAALLSEGPGAERTLGEPEGTLLGRAYGRVDKAKITGLILDPVESIGGTAVSETGSPVPGARIEWNFDTDFAVFANGAGVFEIAGLAPGLDVTVRATASGYRPALTFRRSRAETADPASIPVRLVSEGAYATWGTSFSPPQSPGLGMIFGRVVDRDGSPLAGSRVSLDPAVGQVHYFDAAGNPSASLLQTSASGLFLVLNVPIGNVTLSVVGPGEIFHREIAQSEAGAVTAGEMRGLPTVNVRGKVLDEQQRTAPAAGALVALVEFPDIATIAGGDPLRCDSCFSLDVPLGWPITYRTARTGFKSSYSFTREQSSTPLACEADTPGSETTSRDDCQDLFIISEISYANFYSGAGQVSNRGLGLVAAGVFFSNGDLENTADFPTGALGNRGELTPASAAPRYLPDGKLNDNAITTSGSVQFLNAFSSVAGISLFDPRNDQATLAILKIFPDSVTLTDDQRLDCDTHTVGVFANVYPCDGARFVSGNDAFFIWDLGTNVRAQVQFSTDPSFATIGASGKFVKKQWWRASGKTWKKIKKLVPPGEAVYWRVLARNETNEESFSDPFVFHVP